ncbi:MAG: DUF4271 domain-containing protein [Muribaculum sp.]|nr:DUF4271 domain-containing protein [Muribaculaceae bacterium]MCM1081248.1 DUF4271 domain-containing protein [Muribaculum sp.]
MINPQQEYCLYFDYIARPDSIVEGVVPFTQGLEATARTSIWGFDSSILTLIVGIFLLTLFGMRHYRRFFSGTWRSLTTVRERINAFDDHTIDESGTVVALNLMACVCEAIMLMCWESRSYTVTLVQSRVFITLVSLTALMALYVVLQYATYWIVGYVFTSRTMRTQWLSGFSAVQSTLGLSLLLPAMVAMFYPGASMQFVTLGAIIYICWRIVFICKGFRIFFHNYFSLVYFILYLCSLEIIPLLLLFRCSAQICISLN